MLISEFSEASALSRDTIRFYVGLGLLKPERGTQGGRNAYQQFTADDLQTAKVIRAGQSLGLSLSDIGLLEKERREHGLGEARRVDILRQQLVMLEQKKALLESATTYVAAKIEWLLAGGQGERPTFGTFECRE
ncbi:MAG TPA: MerR family transcriptional regulator [Stenotrophomonas sp.]|jgi:DNA-binding transcriptional MerR regulator